MTECEGCGYRYEDVAPGQIAVVLAQLGPRYRAALRSPSTDERAVGTRPAPDVWSALEYSCHVRDVLLVQRDRTILTLVEHRPSFAPMHREERVELARYGEESLAAVTAQLEMAAELIAAVFSGLTAHQLARPCVYNFPAPVEHDLAWLGRHTIHEGEHHLGDVESVLARVSSART